MKKSIALSAAVLTAAFAFCPAVQAKDQASAEANQQVGQQPQQAGQDTGQDAIRAADRLRARAEQADPQGDQKFVKAAASDNQFEIQLGQFVEQKAQDPQVKQLAQHMVQDHQQAQQQLQQIAQGMNVQLQSDLTPVHQAKLQHMQQMNGQELERNFAFDQVGAHHVDILKYRYEAENGQNAQLKQFAQQTVPTLEQHLRMAEEAAGQWVPQARTAGERMHGDRNHDRTRGDSSSGLNSGASDRTGISSPSGTNASGPGTAGSGASGSSTSGSGTSGSGTSGSGTSGSTGSGNSGVTR